MNQQEEPATSLASESGVWVGSDFCPCALQAQGQPGLCQPPAQCSWSMSQGHNERAWGCRPLLQY